MRARPDYPAAMEAVSPTTLDEISELAQRAWHWDEALRWNTWWHPARRRWRKLCRLAGDAAGAMEGVASNALALTVTTTQLDATRRLAIFPFTEERIPNPPEPQELGGTRWDDIRVELLEVCERHGLTGPEDYADDVDFYLMDDQANDERYHYLYIHTARGATEHWLADVVVLLRRYAGWGIGVTIDAPHHAYLLIYSDRLLVKGVLADCQSAGEVLVAIRGMFDVQRGDADVAADGESEAGESHG